jgi:hypothetical protein
METSDRLPVVVVKEDSEVRFRISVSDPLRFDLAAGNCLDNPVALQFLRISQWYVLLATNRTIE